MELFLVRHSLTQGNVERLYYGSTDLPLLPQGAELAQTLGASGRYPSPESCALFTSGMRRTEETLTCLFGHRPHQSLPAFRELDFGAFEMKSHEMLKEDPLYQAWISGDIQENPCPNGESHRLMAQRVLAGAEALIAQGEDALVVCHAGPISALMTLWFPEEERNPYEWIPGPCEGYGVRFDQGKPVRFRSLPFPAEE